jgi:AraC-like DNA-binding protein
MREATSPLLLTAVVLNGLMLATVLFRASRQSPALRWLAALVVVLAIRLVPYPLGFTGAYDRWKWLTFLPVDASLALGPLLWAYVQALSRGAAPSSIRWHLLPAALQLGYQVLAFMLPQPLKGQYYQRVHVPMVEPIGLVLVLASLAAYTVAAWRGFAQWQQWMDDHLSSREAYRLGSVRLVLVALTLVTAAGVVGAVRHLFVAPLTYGERAPTILGFGVLVYGLGLAGLGQRGRRFPHMADQPTGAEGEAAGDEGDAECRAEVEGEREAASVAPDTARRGRPPVDYAAMVLEWTERARIEGWYRDPELSLEGLANRLHASPRTVSRALREGAGISFHAFVNRLRVEDVRRRLGDPAEQRATLAIALEAGFASKASFNRAFREATGTTAASIRRLNESE